MTSADAPPLLFTFDLNNTIADIDGISHVDRICQISPLSRDEVCRVLYEQAGLKTMRSLFDLTEELVERICAALRIRLADFPFGAIPPAPYRLRPDAAAAVAAAARCLTTAIITNSSVFADPCLRPVSDGLKPHLNAIHASWAMGHAKPSPKAFTVAAAYHGATAAELIHISSSWHRDVVPVLALGGRAVWLNHAQGPVPGPEPVPAGRLVVANGLVEAVDHAIARWLEPASRWPS